MKKKFNKKYIELLKQADIAVGRKETVRLLKKAAKEKSITEDLVA